MMAMGFTRFLVAMRLPLIELARELYTLCKGDPVRAAAVLRRIRDHGSIYEMAQAEVDRRLDALRERR
jgi:hypothetical protein